MFKCDYCEFETEFLAKYAGHRSTHVKRGEIPKSKLKDKTRLRICPTCGEQFHCGMKFQVHIRFDHRDWDLIVKDVTRRTRLIREEGRICSVCKNTEWLGKEIPIELDHIDGNPENNKRDNCRLICPNCHAQTDTYKGRNIGKVKNTKRSKVLKKHYGKYR